MQKCVSVSRGFNAMVSIVSVSSLFRWSWVTVNCHWVQRWRGESIRRSRSASGATSALRPWLARSNTSSQRSSECSASRSSRSGVYDRTAVCAGDPTTAIVLSTDLPKDTTLHFEILSFNNHCWLQHCKASIPFCNEQLSSGLTICLNNLASSANRYISQYGSQHFTRSFIYIRNNNGNTKISFMISKPKFLEPEVGAVIRD